MFWLLASPTIHTHAITTLVPELGLDIEYNDNILFSDQEKIGDTIYRVAPGIGLETRTEALDARLSARARSNNYLDNSEFDGVDQFYLGRLGYRFNPKFESAVEAEYSIDTQIDRDLDTTGLLLTAATRDRLRGLVRGAYAPSELTSAVFNYSYLQDAFDEPELSDSWIHSAALTFNHDLSRLVPKTQGSLIFSYGNYTYERMLTDTVSSGNTTFKATYDESTRVNNYGLAAAILYDWTEMVDMYLNLGGRYTEITFDQAVNQIISNPPNPDELESFEDSTYNAAWAGTGEARLTYQGERNRMDLGLSNDLQPASGRNSPSVRTDFFLLLSRQLTEGIRGSIDTRYYINNTGINPFDLDTLEQQTFILRPTIRFQVNRDIFFRSIL